MSAIDGMPSPFNKLPEEVQSLIRQGVYSLYLTAGQNYCLAVPPDKHPGEVKYYLVAGDGSVQRCPRKPDLVTFVQPPIMPDRQDKE